MSLSEQKESIMLNPDICVKLTNGIQVLILIFKKIETQHYNGYVRNLTSIVEELNWGGIDGIKPRKCAELVQQSIEKINKVFSEKILPRGELYTKFKVAEEILDIAITEIKLVYDED
ncbi:hypothetical protein D3C81_1508980 [compost metagenome]